MTETTAEDRSTWQGWKNGVWIGPCNGPSGRDIVRLKLMRNRATGRLAEVRLDATTLEPDEDPTDPEVIKEAFEDDMFSTEITLPMAALPELAASFMRMLDHEVAAQLQTAQCAVCPDCLKGSCDMGCYQEHGCKLAGH